VTRLTKGSLSGHALSACDRARPDRKRSKSVIPNGRGRLSSVGRGPSPMTARWEGLAGAAHCPASRHDGSRAGGHSSHRPGPRPGPPRNREAAKPPSAPDRAPTMGVERRPTPQALRASCCYLTKLARHQKILEGLYRYSGNFFHADQSSQDLQGIRSASCCYLRSGRWRRGGRGRWRPRGRRWRRAGVVGGGGAVACGGGGCTALRWPCWVWPTGRCATTAVASQGVGDFAFALDFALDLAFGLGFTRGWWRSRVAPGRLPAAFRRSAAGNLPQAAQHHGP